MASIAAYRPSRGLPVHRYLVVLCIAICCVGSCLGAPRVNYISPKRGSLRGATRVEIFGSEFSEDPFSFGDGNENKGNRVWFRNETTSFECDVLNYYTNKDKIVCETRSAADGTFDIYVEVDGQSIEDLGGSYCSNADNCKFTYLSGRTPTIQSVTPNFNVPGNTLTIRGKIFTELYDTTQLNEEDDDAEDLDENAVIIQRIYWGAQIICDPENPETEQLYGIELDSEDSQYGEIICRPDSPLVGSYRMTYLISGEYGRSLSDIDTLYVDHDHKLYHYQTHADILSVTPAEGSLAGGTDVVIEGQYFDYTDPDLAVYIGGIPCEIYNVSRTEILCRTSAVDERVEHVNATVFPGDRGITWEVWSDSFGDLDDESIWNTSKVDYCTKTLDFARSPDDGSCGETDYYMSRFRGFFVPPADGDYSLAVQGDDEAVVYLSQSTRPSDMEAVAYLPSWATSFTKFDTQVSEKLTLEGGVPYYMEARHKEWSAGDFLQVGVFIFDTPLIESQYDGAVSEEQTITVTSTIHNEHQSLTYGDSLQEVQEVRVGYECTGLFCDEDDGDSFFTMTEVMTINTTAISNNGTDAVSNASVSNATVDDCADGNCTDNSTMEGSGSGFLGYFRLSYNGDTTDDIEVGASAMEVQNALNQLMVNLQSTSNSTSNSTSESASNSTSDSASNSTSNSTSSSTSSSPSISNATLSVTVTSHMEGSVTVYKIVFNDFANYSLLEDATYDANIQVNVSRVAGGRENGTAPSSFRLNYGGRLSTSLSFDDSADDVRDALLDMFTVQCQATRSGNPYYFVDYESAAVGNEYGTRVIDEEPFCGRTSLRNPSWVFYAGVIGNKDHFDVRYISKFCFAHRGSGFNKRFYIWISFIDKAKDSRFTSLSIYHEFPQSDNWAHSCIDLMDHVESSWVYSQYLSGTAIYVERIRLYEYVDQTFWIDNLFIGSKDDSYGTRVPASKPGGNFILDVNVEEIEQGFDVELVPAHCGYDFPLMSLTGADINSGSTDAGSEGVTYSSTLWDEGASLRVGSVQQATPPVFGTFTITQEGGGVVKHISGQSTADQMRESLETFLDTGDLKVTRTGSCKGFTWNVKWVSAGGSQGLMQVSENNLYNNVTLVNVTAHRVAEGGVMLSKIPAQFLRTANNVPQVEVIVNNIPSSCSNGSCSFMYTPAATPTLVSVSPSQGSADDGTSITITGTGFSDYASENNVTIGGADCMVTSSNETTIVCDVGPAQGGVYNISVEVDGKGDASLPSGGVEFEYSFDVTGVSPSEGSSAGGTEVTLSGYGLGGMTDVDISVGSNDCVIQSTSYDEIVCVVVIGPSSRRRRRSTTDVDVAVTIGDVTVTVNNGFTFDDNLTPTVTSIDPEYSSVLGGGDLTISGSSFGTSGAVVMIGSTECSVTSQTASSIVCELPASPPGDYELDVTIDGVGLADTSAIGLFSYLLEVTGVFPDSGSMQGGTQVTITGAGFGTDADNITVSMGGYECAVNAIADDELSCITDSTTVTHYVDNNGRHNTYGLGYKWDPQFVTINAGDEVNWSWTIDPYVTGIGYAVQQTEDADALGYDGTGFYSGGRSTSSDSYTYKFYVPGLYYYSSGPVNSAGTIYMKGVVEVLDPVSSALEVDVSIGSYSANHNTTSGVADPSAGGGCSGEDSAISGCEASSPNGDDADTFYFKYYECMTPVISAIDPLVGDSSDTIVIDGSGFSSDDCANEVMVGDYPCDVTSSSSSRIECEIDTMDEMDVGVYHEISVNVANRGYALHESAILANRSFVMYPRIDSVSDDGGSIEGGLTLIIQGDGFAPSSASAIGMYIGSLVCGIDFYNYTYIECTTPAASSYGVNSLRLQVNSLWATWGTGSTNTFEYRADETPVVTGWSPGSLSGDSTSMTFSGSYFSTTTDDVTVLVGGEVCTVTASTNTQIDCDVSLVPVGTRSVTINIVGMGLAQFYYGNDTVTSVADIFSVSPTSGSTKGGQMVNITGNGFVDGVTAVTINGEECQIESISLSEIVCASPAGSAATVDLVVVSDGVTYAAEDYIYASASTPTVDSISPTSGSTGDSITISGSAFSDDAGDVTVEIDGVGCTVTSASTTQVVCDAGPHSAGVFTLNMHVAGLGYGDSSETFEYELIVTSTSPAQGSFGGGQTLVIEGSGYDDTTTVTVCGADCPFYSVNETAIECDVPANSDTSATLDCDIVVSLPSGSMVEETTAYQYRQDLTPVIYSVSPARGGTGGGTTITIVGEDFLDSGNEVTIAGTTCSILTENTTVITCQTGAHSPSERTQVRLTVGSNGIATQDDADYFYIDVWSSIYTWGGLDPPVAGDFVIIPAGQTILLDITTPILKVLLIQGGEMIFDEADIELHAEYVVVVDGGHFEIGTEDQPFEHEASVVMHGHVRSKELPLFGAKTFAVRNGTVDMHGRPTPITWSYLAETVSAGDSELTLMDAVNWRVGDHIVLASTGTRHKQTQNEEVVITDVSNDNTTIGFSPAVEFEHISISQVVDGVLLETRGEVGLLTHNVKIRGSVHEDWVEEVEACPDEFDTNQFATQTCFQGRFGAETVTDQFGSQIMFFAKEQDAHLVHGRFEHIEVTHAGQAFRLGRYPIHYHMSGNITGSYVRGCGIHHTFNRAVTIHGVHHLLVERNVAFNVMGHAYFLEDGIETKNIIQYNLAVFVRPSSSLLNVDVTPASFWVTNADNYVRHNAAAGGSHFGFWYNAPGHPEGPSFTSSICPVNVPVLEFQNNTAHTMGWYGIWIFPNYFPKEGGSCSGASAPAKFYSLTAWRCERGAEGVAVGAIQFHDFLMADNDKAGIEFQTVSGPWGDQGPLVKDSVIIGYSDELAEGNEASRCTSAGIHLPKSKFLTVDGAKMINFDQDKCAALRACAHCKPDQGGFQHRFKNMEFTNSPNKAAFLWEHETWFEDLDGTLTGNDAGYMVTPTNNGLPTDHCSYDEAKWSVGFPGTVCDDTVKLHRMAFNNPAPSSLKYKNAILTNEYGTSSVPWQMKRLTHPEGWMSTLVESETYNFYFEHVDHVTNISYVARFDEFSDGEYVIMNHNFTQNPDAFALTGQITENVGHPLTYDDDHAEWYFDNNTNNMFYMISGKGLSSDTNRNIDLDVYRCYYKDCIPPVPEAPPSGRPDDVLYWGEAEAWADVSAGWGGNTDSGSAVPQNGDNVMIMPGLWVVANDTLPWMNKLFIYGTLEIDDQQDMLINATYILIQGGQLIAGFNETNPFTHDLRILLNGHHFTQDIPLPNGPNLGSKALGVFGTLNLHGRPRDVSWTHLAATVQAGDSEITVAVDTDWVSGDEIVVTSTSFEAWHTETFKISSRVDARTFALNGTFAHMHTVEQGSVNDKSYTIAAEVGLLTRNIVIEGNDYDLLFDESFGARTIVGTFIQDGEFYRGSGHFANVEFKLTGQEGWTDFYDPRYSLSFLDIGDVLEDPEPSYVKSCTFHNGFSPAIGVFGTDNIEVDNNVIHHTVGSGIKSFGRNTRITNNLVTLMVFPGTYQDRFETTNLDWMGSIDVAEATDPILINNTIAGTERVGFNIKGEKCSEPSVWANNVVHSSYHGVHVFKTGQDPCLRVKDFTAYRNSDYGVYLLTFSNVELQDMTLVDNSANIYVSSYSPAALSHVRQDKYVLVENSLIVGYSESFDCDHDKVTPEGASQSSNQRPPKSPEGGNVGVFFTSYKSGPGGAPKKPFTKVSSYPGIGGQTIVRDTTFYRFNDHCGGNAKAIMTSPPTNDAHHPMDVENLQFVDTPTENYLWMHRPELGKVNPSDCVDMDCDGKKKSIIRDLDGSLLGSPGTIIPDAAFEWDGDRRRGLGDYRIPKMMLTTPDGARIPKEDKAPYNGIIRNDDCVWQENWQSWECHDLDHMMMVVESMDADTEVRRVSPVALLADGYVDLVNGPQDQGWCLGYTCQERISTFYTIVATNKNYELYFTGTNPQSLRFHLLNANISQALTVGIWYANPQRLDVYVNGLYIIPTNGEYVNGALQWIAPGPDTDFFPSLNSMVLGENYFDRDLGTLFILVRGSDFVEIKTTPVVITTFGVPAVEVDNFFEENLVENLANLLDIDASQIRVVEIISEARRKKRSSSDVEVVIEIGESPAATSSTGGVSNTTTTTPAPATESPTTTTTLDFNALLDVQANLAAEMQTGKLSDSLGVTVTRLAMTDPVEEPVDPTGGVRATNATGGPADGNETYAEQQAAEEELALSTAGQPVEYVVAGTLELMVEPAEAIEGSAFGQQPKLRVLDNSGNLVEQLGTNARPWLLTATVSSVSSQGTVGFIGENETVAFVGGWANFTDIGVNTTATDLVIEFVVTYPNTSSLTASSSAFSVEAQPYELVAITSPTSDIAENQVFEVIVELQESNTGEAANLADKGYEWPATIAISDPTNYRGELQGDVSTTLDLNTARATFELSIDASSYYYVLEVSVTTSPSSSYSASISVDPFNVVADGTTTHSGEPVSLTIRFDYDYSSIADGNEDLLAANFLNHIAPNYPNATFSNVQISQGSILISFDITGDVDYVQSQIWEDILDGDLSLTFNGQTMVADEYFMVDGTSYSPTSNASSLPVWAIIVIVTVVVVIILLSVIVYLVMKQNQAAHHKVATVEQMPLQMKESCIALESLAGSETSGSSTVLHASLAPTVVLDPSPPPPEGIVNKHLVLDDDETHSQRSTLSARSRSPGIHSARRSPEVSIMSLPPGFLDGQVETELADRVNLFIMVKNSDGTFQKLGSVGANMVGTVSQLRKDLKAAALPAKVRDKPFVILRETLKEIEPSDEKKLTVSEVYTSDCVLIKWNEEQDMTQLCICGLVGQFHCSLCQKQAYCSPQCQSTDWPRHSYKCSQWATDN